MGFLPILFLAAAVNTVNQDQVPLRAACGESERVVTTVHRGDPVEIRFALSGGSGTCYKVSVESGGESYEGYLPASALADLKEFDRARRAARTVEAPEEVREDLSAVRQADVARGSQDVAQAARLLDENQPVEALRLLEQALRANRRDAGVLAMAGMAAYQGDRIPDAIGYWEESLALAPSRPVERLLAAARRERQADQSSEKLYGARFALRYDPGTVTADQAREIVPMLDAEFARVSEQLGCRAEERITTVIQSREDYLKTTGAAEWSGGAYDGRIRVALLEPQPGPETRRAFAHEIVHACLARIGNWPAWLHEGLAQKLSGATLDPRERDAIQALAAAGKLPSLSKLSQTYSRMNSESAALAYAESLAAVEALYDGYGPDGVRSLLQSPNRLEQITTDLDRRLHGQQ